MTGRGAALVALIAACNHRPAPAPAPPAPPPATPATPRADLLRATDVALADKVKAFLDAPEHGAALIRPLEDGGIAQLFRHDIGFGATAHAQPAFERGVGCTFGALERSERTVMVRVDCEWKDAAPSFVVDPRIERTPRERGIVFTWQDARAMASLRADAAEVLGPVPATPPPPDDLRAAFELLGSPLADARVGESCGENGGPPAGKKAVTAIAKAGRVDLLRVVARGLSPDGRVYALRALRARPGGLDREDAPLFERVKKLDVPIRVCSGCMNRDRKACDVLEDEDL